MSIIKKNKLPLFLLAVVMMLSAFYIFAPNNGDSLPSGGNGLDTQTTYSYFAEERLNIIEERSNKITELENKIAAGTLTVVQITNTLETIKKIHNLTNLEAEIETALIALGYDDVLVEKYELKVNLGTESKPEVIVIEKIDVKLLDVTLKASDYIAINSLIKSKVNSSDCKVSLIFKQSSNQS